MNVRLNVTHMLTKEHTDQLQNGEVALPPEVFGHAWSKSCQSVVQIHHYMDQGVDQTNQESCGWIHRKSITYNVLEYVFSCKLS